MKHNIASLILCGMTAGTLALSSCNNAEYSVLTNQAYIAQTQTDGNTSVKITLGKEAVTQELNVRLSDPTDEKCTFKIARPLIDATRHRTKRCPQISSVSLQARFRSSPDSLLRRR